MDARRASQEPDIIDYGDFIINRIDIAGYAKDPNDPFFTDLKNPADNHPAISYDTVMEAAGG